MRLKKLFLGLFLILSTLSFAQSSTFSLASLTKCYAGSNLLCALPTSKVYLCPYLDSPYYTGVCASPVTLYTDPTLTTIQPSPLTPDYLGNVTAYVPTGNYIVQYVSQTGLVLYQQPVGSSSATVNLNNIASATGYSVLFNGDNKQVWNWNLTTNYLSGFALGESLASTGTNTTILNISTLSGSTASPFQATAQSTNNGVQLTPSGVLQAIGSGSIIANGTNLYINTALPLTGGGVFNSNLNLACPTCVSTNTANTYTAGPQDLNSNPLTVQIGNASSGTANHLLAKLTSSGATTLLTTDTTVPAYIVNSGAGTSGNAKLAVAGQQVCTMDATTLNSEGWYVIASVTNAGYCHPQSAIPASTFVIGTLALNGSSAGSPAPVQVGSYYIGSNGGSGLVNAGTAGQLAAYATSGAAVSGLPSVTFSGGNLTLGVTSSVLGTLSLLGSSGGGLAIEPPAFASGINTLQSVTDTFVYRASTDTLTNKTINAESTGNNISIPAKAFFSAAGCINGTAASSWDIGASNQPTAVCVGTNSVKGKLQFARGNQSYINFELPSDWNSSANVDLRIAYTTTDTTSGHVTAFDVQTGCNNVNGTTTDDPVLNLQQIASLTTGSGAVSGGSFEMILSGVTMTGCAANFNLVVSITRDNSGTDTNTDTAVAVKYGELTFSRTMNGSNR